MNVAGVRAALRIARRDALRAKGRSALVVAMIGLPMFGLAAADVAVRTAQLPPSEVAVREIGAADLVAEHVSDGPIVQRDRYDYSEARPTSPDSAGAMPTKPPPDVSGLLPLGSRVTVRHAYYGVLVDAGELSTRSQVQQLDLADDLSRGLVRLRSGRLPTARDETLVTPRLARALGVGLGGTVTFRQARRSFRVVGTGLLPSSLDDRTMFVANAAGLPAPKADPGSRTALIGSTQWAVGLPPGVRDLDVLPALNGAGLRVTPRTWYANPPRSPYASDVDANQVGVVVVVVGLAALEIVLLAGTAFAVGARRKRRELALVVATGGDRGDVKRIVLAGGVVLGAVAGVLGIGGGIVAVVLARPLLERLGGALLGPLDVRPLEIAAIVGVAVGTALLATLLPARAAAKQPVVAALTGRRGELRTPRRVPVLALLAIAVGAPLAFWAAGDGKVNAIVAATNGESRVTEAGRPAHFLLLLAGAVIAELGFVACAPSLVGLVGRLGSRLPLSLRLAARDAARHRSRTGPAVGAVVAAVAGSVALSVYLASDTERQRVAYRPRYPAGTVWFFESDIGRAGPGALDAVAATLPVRERIAVQSLGDDCGARGCVGWQMEALPEYRCDGVTMGGCDESLGSNFVAVGPPSLATWAAGRDDERIAAALRAGSVVLFDGRWVKDGHVTFGRIAESTVEPGTAVRLPAVVVDAPRYDGTPVAILTPETARAHKLPSLPSGTVFTTTRPPTDREESAARGAATRGGSVDFYVERGFRPDDQLALLILVAAATLVTVGATGMATGLAAADSRPDLATLAAVGAPPRVRRRLAMAQAATVAALGTGLGILAGLVPSVAVVAARAEFPFVTPWAALAATAVGVPLLAALLVGAVTRGRLPLERRLA